MLSARLCIEQTVEPALALSRAYALWDAVHSDEPVALYGATLHGHALVLGAYQRAENALAASTWHAATPVLRRRSGGITVAASDGVVYVALGLHDRSALMACPHNRILNRNVRGALQGLRALGVAAHYFGRDFISVESRPAAFVGWDARPDGRVLLEFFIAARASYLPTRHVSGYAERSADPLLGKSPITLAEARARELDAEVVRSIATGYAAMTPIDWREHAIDAKESQRASTLTHELRAATSDDAMTWSQPREEAIGFVSAGVALDRSGKIHALRLAGDFFQDSGCSAALERTLLGVEPSAELVGRALDTVYGHGTHELEGVRSLLSFREVILEAAAHARPTLT